MAAFLSRDPADNRAFSALWRRIISDSSFLRKTVLFEGEAAGHIVRFLRAGRPEVTYWYGREFWGKGIATAALRAFLLQVPERPLYARAASDNLASLRVLEKCGFLLDSTQKSFAEARGAKIQESVMVLH